MTPAFLRASLELRHEAAAQILGLSLPTDWPDSPSLLTLRLAQLVTNPGLQPWLLRAIGLRSTHELIGHVGFHDASGSEHLKPISPGSTEIGISIFSPYRRQGYAHEAIRALMHWAHHSEHVPRFIMSISPANVASNGLAAQLGFVRIGSQIDPEDGLEEIFELKMPGGI